jgi:DNA-binding CsgD family transcriptional regulator
MLRCGFENVLSQMPESLTRKYEHVLITEVTSLEEIPLLFVFLETITLVSEYEKMTFAILTNDKEVLRIKSLTENFINVDLGVDNLYYRLVSHSFKPLRLEQARLAINECCRVGILTSKEEELLFCIIRGFNIMETSRLMNIKQKTVYGHMTHLKEKLGQSTTAKMIFFIRQYYRWFIISASDFMVSVGVSEAVFNAQENSRLNLNEFN